jgi:hypothetical protein
VSYSAQLFCRAFETMTPERTPRDYLPHGSELSQLI